MFSAIPYPLTGRSLLVLLSVCFTVPAFIPAAHAVTFNEALRLAREQAPQVKSREESITAAQFNLQPSGALPDPKLIVGLENVPIDGTNRYSLSSEPMTMRRIGLMQEFPNSSKLDARVSAAQGRIGLAETQGIITRLMVSRETAVAWIARRTAEQQLASIEQLRAENRLLSAAVKAMLSGGKGNSSDAVAPRQEAAMIENRADEWQARRSQATAALSRWIGVAANDALLGDAPDFPVVRNTLLHAVHRHPELTEFDAKARVLDAEISEAQAAKTPDWALEFAYQKRDDQFGDMASIQVRFDLPVLSASRQDPRIRAKRAERAGLDAEREGTLREHAAMVESDLAEHQRLVNALQRQREIMMPLADEKVALSMAAWRGGKGSLAEVINARSERIDTELKSIELDGQRLQIAARLYYANNEQAGEQP